MGVKLPLRLSLRLFVLLFQSALLIFVASVISGPARADDCSTVPYTCLREAIASNGNSRILSVTLSSSTGPAVSGNALNVIVPGHSQFEVKVGGTFTLNVQPDGTAVYSVQFCTHYGLAGTDCAHWTQVARHFAPASTCQSYMSTAMTAVNQNDNLGCGFAGARWDHNALAHLNACLNSTGDWQSFINSETSGRANDLAACQARIAAATPCPAGQIHYQGGACRVPPVLSGSSTGTGGGFIQLNPAGNVAASSAAAATPPPGSGYVLACRGGGDMNISGGGATVGGPSFFDVSFAAAAQGANAATPDPGTCAWLDRALRPGEPLVLNIPNQLANADRLKRAIGGGSFQVHANSEGKDLLVNQIDQVRAGGGSVSVGVSSGTQGTDAQDNNSGNSVLQPPIAEDSGGSQPMTIAKAVNVHTTAGGGSVLGSLGAGTAVTSLGCSKGWCHIQFAGGEGYVAQSFTAPQ